MDDIVDLIKRDVISKYGDVKVPNFSFAEKEYKKSKYRNLIFDLSGSFYIKNLTDLNDDVSFQISIKGLHKEWVLGISFLGPYAVLLRVEKPLVVIESS
ncbi:MAG: hypothetical protein GY850_47130 [bacterium]|nr:hypothetical protein [bacterium]